MQPPRALNEAFAAGDTAAVLAESLGMEGATSVLDIGCGRGALAKALTARGFAVTGIDPQDEAVRAARATAADAEFHVGSAENLPFADASFDGVVFLNSLHHVPEPALDRALGEAARVVRPGGPVLIVEPLAEGTFFEAMRPVEDETTVREAAGKAVARSVREKRFELRGNVVFERRESFPDTASFLARVVAVDPARKAVAETKRAEVEARLATHAERTEAGFTLKQPLRIYWLRPAD